MVMCPKQRSHMPNSNSFNCSFSGLFRGPHCLFKHVCLNISGIHGTKWLIYTTNTFIWKYFFFKGALAIKKKQYIIFIPHHTIVAGFNGFTLVICVCPCFCLSVCLAHSEVSISVEFHIMRFMSVYFIIMRLNCFARLKKIKERSKG